MTKRRPRTLVVPTRTAFGDSNRARPSISVNSGLLSCATLYSCEFVHQPAFSVVDGGQVRRDFAGVQAEFSGPFHQRQKIRTSEQRLGGHAAAQDAKAAERALVDNGDAGAVVRGDASGGIARAASTYDDDVVNHVMAPGMSLWVGRPVPVSESTIDVNARQEKNRSNVATARTALL